MRVRIPPTQQTIHEPVALPRLTHVCSEYGRLIKARTRFITPSRQPLTKRPVIHKTGFYRPLKITSSNAQVTQRMPMGLHD